MKRQYYFGGSSNHATGMLLVLLWSLYLVAPVGAWSLPGSTFSGEGESPPGSGFGLACGGLAVLPEGASSTCGVIRPNNRYFQGRRGENAKVYIPVGGPYADIYNKLACLAEKANAVWQEACPKPGTLNINPYVPIVEIVRGPRPAESRDPDLVYDPDYTFDVAEYDSNRNTLFFSAFESWSCDASSGEADPYHVTLAAHELGHFFGLNHDFCTGEVSTEPHSVMETRPTRARQYQVYPDHCAAIEKANCTQECGGAQLTQLDPGGDCPCCFFCNIPPLEERCLLAPMLCGTGGYYEPPGGSWCVYQETTVTFRGTIEITYPGGTTVITGDLYSFTTSSIECYVLEVGGEDPQEATGESALAGDGPIVFLRSRYPEGASGQVPIAGVARDDVYGISGLSFWIDGQHAPVQNLRTGLFDAELCTEIPASSCNPNSRFEGILDVSGLPDGTHTLQVLATNGRGTDPIPTYYEMSFEVANGATGCTDTTLPAITMTAPAAGALVQGAATVTFSASDSSGIEAVGLYVDGAWVEDDLAAPYTFSLDTTAYADGALELKGKAEDGCGNVRFTPPRTVTVGNGPEVSLSFAPSDDTFSHQDHPDSPFGAYNFLRLRTIDGGHGRHGYLRFSVTGVVGPVVSATLRLRTQETALTTDSVGVYKLTETPWTEETLTWNNAPLTVVQSVEIAPPFAADTWHELDVTELVTGNGTYSFGLATGANQGGLDFWTKESIYAPQLEVVSIPSAAPGGGER